MGSDRVAYQTSSRPALPRQRGSAAERNSSSTACHLIASWDPSTILVEPMNQSSLLQPPDRSRVDEQIAAAIADAILDGAFPPGSTLPPERELAEQLGVNRTSLRQGLARLQQMGLIEAKHGSGNVVRDPE